MVAHQRAITVGDVVGNDYVVQSGLKPGDRIVASGVQKLGDGMPIMALPAPPPEGGAPGNGAPGNGAPGGAAAAGGGGPGGAPGSGNSGGAA